ncbi:uncharacterized protein LOC143676488 isoform X3 [Tamandua tetradactyla]
MAYVLRYRFTRLKQPGMLNRHMDKSCPGESANLQQTIPSSVPPPEPPVHLLGCSSLHDGKPWAYLEVWTLTPWSSDWSTDLDKKPVHALGFGTEPFGKAILVSGSLILREEGKTDNWWPRHRRAASRRQPGVLHFVFRCGTAEPQTYTFVESLLLVSNLMLQPGHIWKMRRKIQKRRIRKSRHK